MANILIVEDDRVVRRLCAFILMRAGHCVREASTMKEAQRIFGKHVIDLAVIDLVLPGGGSGTDCAIGLIRANSQAKIVLMSGWPIDWYGRDSENMQMILEKSYEILRKPFGPDELVQAVSALISQTFTGTV